MIADRRDPLPLDRGHGGATYSIAVRTAQIAKAPRDWIAAVVSKTAYIEPVSPWENGYCESFNAKLRDELLDGEIVYKTKEVSVVIERWRKHYNSIRPHASLGYRPPAPEVIVWPVMPVGSVPPVEQAIVGPGLEGLFELSSASPKFPFLRREMRWRPRQGSNLRPAA